MIRIAARERIDRSAVRGVDDENASDRCFAVVRHQCARRHHVNHMLIGAVEMDAVIAVMLGAGRQNVFFVERVDDEQQAPSLILPRGAGEGALILGLVKRPRTSYSTH
jgi:hypothetical protein